ncbi:hypothetical protein GYMLUDRAFT_253242 [Collybiopsis luxurians FD-317 M1]|uniref:Uncharacterized protein n=1 Tax=Collybiopsis luxurians FD-317 M1 TaxID=944289 RepID=A0A0D0AIZ9_9AGAR|nr:hypothetical protein GYMLUDRAFT_253242 [Collybiopsis luxurians FD-317 M1]
MLLRLKKRGEKALEQALNGTSPTDIVYKSTEGTIPEDEEPSTPGPGKNAHTQESATAGDDVAPSNTIVIITDWVLTIQ